MKQLKYTLYSLVLALSVLPAIAQNLRFNIYTEGELLYSMPVSLIDSINVDVLPDTIAPYLKKGGLYNTNDNNGRSITLQFNEPIVRGDGEIKFFITGLNTSEVYANGTIDNVEIDGIKATITLPEWVGFDPSYSTSLVFIELETGAFIDEYGHESKEIKRGDAKAPWWSSNEHPLQALGILGTYNCSGTSAFDGVTIESWSCEIIGDPNDINGVWISQLSENVDYADFTPIYGVVSADKTKITIESGQGVGTYKPGEDEYDLKLDFHGPTQVDAILSGTEIIIPSLVGYAAYLNNQGRGYLFAVQSITLTKVGE